MVARRIAVMTLRPEFGETATRGARFGSPSKPMKAPRGSGRGGSLVPVLRRAKRQAEKEIDGLTYLSVRREIGYQKGHAFGAAALTFERAKQIAEQLARSRDNGRVGVYQWVESDEN